MLMMIKVSINLSAPYLYAKFTCSKPYKMQTIHIYQNQTSTLNMIATHTFNFNNMFESVDQLLRARVLRVLWIWRLGARIKRMAQLDKLFAGSQSMNMQELITTRHRIDLFFMCANTLHLCL